MQPSQRLLLLEASPLGHGHALPRSQSQSMTFQVRTLSPSHLHVQDKFCDLISMQKLDRETMYIRAASVTASRVDSSARFSFSSSVFANWRPLPTAAPLYPYTASEGFEK
jgi:hypothetical protein